VTWPTRLLRPFLTTLPTALLSALALASCGRMPPAARVPGQPVAVRWCDSLPRPANAALERVPVGSDWFEVYRLDSGVFAISEPRQFQEVISYLIVGQERALLFDTGLGVSPIRPVVSELTTLPVQVLNSHTHYDHAGGNAEFDRILAVNTAYTRANTRGFPHSELAGEVTPESWCRSAPAGLDTATWHTRPWSPTRFVPDGYRVDLGGRVIEVLQVPGHTPDAVALLDRAAGLLWTGDSFYQAPIWLYVPETDLDAYARSVDRMAALVPALKKLFGSHNIVAGSPPERLLQLKRALALVRAGKATGMALSSDRIQFGFDGFALLFSKPGLDGRKGDQTRGGSGLTTWPPESQPPAPEK